MYARPDSEHQVEQWAAKRTKMMRVTLTPADWRTLRILAAERETSLQAVVAGILDNYLAVRMQQEAELRVAL